MLLGLPKAETQALTNYDSREVDEEEEETEESEARPADVQTSADGQLEPEVGGTQNPGLLKVLTPF